MAVWLIPALKAVLPHVGTIITAAKPVFTKKSLGEEANQAQLVQQQIAELQTAVTDNAENIKELAAQLQDTVKALEHAATLAETRLRRALIFSGTAMVAACIALVLVLLI